MKILIQDKFGPELPDMLAKYGEVFVGDSSKVPEADVILIRSKTKVRGEYLDSAKNLKLVIRGGVGIDNIDLETCKARGIEVRNTPTASAIAVAEMAFALMLGLLRHIPAADQGTKAGEWPKKALGGTELNGKTLGLLGVGNIGGEVAKRAKAFGMTVIAHDLPGVVSDVVDEMVDFESLLGRSDFLSLHIPATPKTIGLIDAGAMAKMKDTAVLVNTARGKVVDYDALAEALHAGKMGGAAIDVYPAEPVENDAKILSAPNTVLAPHLGASTKENMLRIGEIAEQIVGAFAAK